MSLIKVTRVTCDCKGHEGQACRSTFQADGLAADVRALAGQFGWVPRSEVGDICPGCRRRSTKPCDCSGCLGQCRERKARPKAKVYLGSDDPISLAEAARMCGASAASFSNWRKRYADFPAPVVTLSGHEFVSRSAVWSWFSDRWPERMTTVPGPDTVTVRSFPEDS
jgi:hypothetical protein